MYLGFFFFFRILGLEAYDIPHEFVVFSKYQTCDTKLHNLLSCLGVVTLSLTSLGRFGFPVWLWLEVSKTG